MPPITLYIRRTINRYRISRGQPTVIGNAIIRVEEYEVHDSRDNARNLVEERIVVAWHKICHLSQKVRHMYAFFPNVSSRLRARMFVATHYITLHRLSRATGHSRRDCIGWDWPRTLDVAAL